MEEKRKEEKEENNNKHSWKGEKQRKNDSLGKEKEVGVKEKKKGREERD